MLCSLFKTLIRRPPLLSFRLVSTNADQYSFTVSYLVNSCGLSPESALSASKRVNFKSSTRPDSVIDIFKNHGFSPSHIADIIRKLPSVLSSCPEKTLSPKFNYLRSLGFSNSDLSRIVTYQPRVLTRSLENHIIPTFISFRDLFQCNKKAISAIKRCPAILAESLERGISPNIEFLRDNGVHQSSILYLLLYQPRVLLARNDRIKEVVERIRKMGLDPSHVRFVVAISALVLNSESTWERKSKIYRRWGWSREDVILAFSKDPGCMKRSDKKIMQFMEFLVDEMGFDSVYFVQNPWLLSLSLEKRIVPRCLVLKHLLKKGLQMEKFSVATLLQYPEKCFLQKFVTPHLEKAPELLCLYQQKIGTVTEISAA